MSSVDPRSTPPAGAAGEDTPPPNPNHAIIERLKTEMKKEASVLDYVPLDAMHFTTQTAVPGTAPQMCELGTFTKDNRRLTLVALLSAKHMNKNKTDGGLQRIMFFGHGPDGLSDAEKLTAIEVSRINTLSRVFMPASKTQDLLSALMKYVFLAKGAPFPEDVEFKKGFIRGLSQACRLYQNFIVEDVRDEQVGEPEEDAAAVPPQDPATVPDDGPLTARDNDSVFSPDDGPDVAPDGDATLVPEGGPDHTPEPHGSPKLSPHSSPTDNTSPTALLESLDPLSSDEEPSPISPILKRKVSELQQTRQRKAAEHAALRKLRIQKLRQQTKQKEELIRVATEEEKERAALREKQEARRAELLQFHREKAEEVGKTEESQLQAFEEADGDVSQVEDTFTRRELLDLVPLAPVADVEERPAKRQKLSQAGYEEVQV